MRHYIAIVTCATCGKELLKSAPVPEASTIEAAIAASTRAFCEGHSKNSNLNFAWALADAPPAQVFVGEAATGGAVTPLRTLPAVDEPKDAFGIPLAELHRLELEENAIEESAKVAPVATPEPALDEEPAIVLTEEALAKIENGVAPSPTHEEPVSP